MGAGRKIAALLTVALWLATRALGRAQLVSVQKMGPDLQVNVHTEISGDVSVNAWTRDGGVELAPVLPEVVHCQGGVRQESGGSSTVICSKALRRDGLAFEEVVDLAPIARNLDTSTGIQLWVNYPRLGFDSSSLAMTDEDGGGSRVSHSARFEAGAVPSAIHIRFGYQPDQLAGIYFPLVGLALALTLIAAVMARSGLAGLSRSAVLLGTIVWMGVAAQLGADGPLRILLFGNPFASLAALFVELWPPLFCVAIGVALGDRMRTEQARSGRGGEVLGSLAVIPLLLTCVIGALPPMMNGDWTVTAIWLATVPILLLLRRIWIRASARSRLRQVDDGELKERVSALAARAGCPKVKIYISLSKRSEIANAFALPGKSIFLTAPLVRSLSKREVDAVAAHELSHFRHANRGIWMALCMAMLFYETPARDLLLYWPGGLFIAMLAPITVFMVSLHGMRKREFTADAGAAALTGDPRAMISALARIARLNSAVNMGSIDMNAVAEWFSSHPSTARRIRALAALARLDAAEVDSLCSSDDRGERYELAEQEDGGAIFTPTWQRANAGVYGWVVIVGSCCSGLLVAWLIDRSAGSRFGGYGAFQILGGIALGCALTKALAAASMWSNFARLRRKLEARLGVRGQLVGLAMDSEPRLYNGFRFSDAGVLWFERGRLRYQSERIAIALNPADVVEVGMVAASPSNWVRRQPMVRFRRAESGEIQAFILHPVDWLPRQQRLLKSIKRWMATESSPESTSVSGFNPIAGQPFTNPTIIEAARGFLVPGGITLVAAISACWTLQARWEFVACALAVSACSHVFLFLPAMLYRAPALPPDLTVSIDVN